MTEPAKEPKFTKLSANEIIQIGRLLSEHLHVLDPAERIVAYKGDWSDAKVAEAIGRPGWGQSVRRVRMEAFGDVPKIKPGEGSLIGEVIELRQRLEALRTEFDEFKRFVEGIIKEEGDAIAEVSDDGLPFDRRALVEDGTIDHVNDRVFTAPPPPSG